MRLFVTIVLDGVGIGEQPDAANYGDEGSDTLGHICQERPLIIPNLVQMGLGNIRELSGVQAEDNPTAAFGKLTEVSAGKDSTTGHWELAGLLQSKPFPTYPDGFPDDLIDSFIEQTKCPGVLGNRAVSGTTIVSQLGDKHIASRRPIVYTSADSVFQIATHVDVYPLEELYSMCEVTRERVCVGEHEVGRVIARPFLGESGAYSRISEARRDFSLKPRSLTLQEALQAEGITTVSIGKIYDLFGGVGFSEWNKTKSNKDGVEALLGKLAEIDPDGPDHFIWVNLVDFDQDYGHRNDPEGFAQALERFDSQLPRIVQALPEGSRLLLTADHGNDPTTPSTDHSREFVPLLYYGTSRARDLGIRSSFRDHAASVADYFDIEFESGGKSFN